MKKIYDAPKIEIVELDEQDVITLSGLTINFGDFQKGDNPMDYENFFK